MKTPSVVDLDRVPAELANQGYAVLRSVVSPDRLSQFREELLEAYARSEKFTGGGSITGHLNCFPGRSAAFVYDELAEAGIVEAVHRIRAGRDNSIRSTLNLNLPGSVPQHCHMDGLYVEDFLICNVAVVDTTVHNGAIALLPGTSRTYLPYWQYAMERRYRLSTQVEMAQGDVLLRKSNLWHRGMPNKSSVPRPMMSITFGELSAPQSDPFEGEISFYPNWYSTTRLGVFRERAFVAAPLTYSAYRFVKSLTGKRGYASY
jgi:ectoine hydroxylase-related dioxygenase (phytanoyl-CoA dioxygenase family)